MRKLVCLMGLFLAMNVMAQRTFTYETSGDAMLLHELRAMLDEKDGSVIVAMALPVERRPEGYRDFDIQKDDLIPFINKKRIRSMAAFKEIYEGLAIGDTVMLGVKRGDGDMFILRFPKIDPEKSGLRTRMMTAPAGGDLSNMKILPEAGLMLREMDRQVKVAGGMPNVKDVLGFEPQKDDVLVSINGNEVSTLDMVGQFYDQIKTGDEVTMEFLRGDETLKAVFKKVPPQGGVMMMR